MSQTHHSHRTYHPIFNSSCHPIPSSSSLFNPCYASPNTRSSSSRNSLLRFPNTSEDHSLVTNSRNTDLIYHDIRQPHLNPHARFLNRSIETCPKYLTGSKQTKWLKAGKKARQNQELLTHTDSFHWPTSHYDAPIHIHHQTPLNIVRSLTQRMSTVHLFTIDTESDKPSIQHPTPVPALIQIQAIHSEHSATVILIEVQHLLDQSTVLFFYNFICLISPILRIISTFNNISHVNGIKHIHIQPNVIIIIIQLKMIMNLVSILFV